MDNEYEIQEITAARNLMQKKKAMYVASYQTFTMENGLEKTYQEEITEFWSNYCGKMFRKRKEVDNTRIKHVSQPVMNGPQS